MPSFAINNHIFNLVQGLFTGNTASVHLILPKGPAAQLRYMSTNQKCELKKSIYMSNSVRLKVQFGANTCTWFRDITSFDRFDSTSSPLWDCDLGSSRMGADHYEGINLSAALQAQHLAAWCDSKSAEPGWFLNDVFLLGFNSRLWYRQKQNVDFEYVNDYSWIVMISMQVINLLQACYNYIKIVCPSILIHFTSTCCCSALVMCSCLHLSAKCYNMLRTWCRQACKFFDVYWTSYWNIKIWKYIRIYVYTWWDYV